MFANFTEERCLGTGDTLSLTGVTAGNIPFSASFADGDLIAYVVEDSGGNIKVSGVGTYESVSNTITRSDTWNYDGTVVNKNPSSNIALSTGIHTVRCDAVEKSFSPSFIGNTYDSNFRFFQTGGLSVNTAKGGGEYSASNARFALEPFYLPYTAIVSVIGCTVKTASVGGNFRCAIYRYSHSSPCRAGELVLETGDLSTDLTGFISQSLPSPVLLESGIYYSAVAVDNTTATFYGARKTESADLNLSLNGGDPTDRYLGEAQIYFNKVYGSFPQDLSLSNPDGVTGWGVPVLAYR